jgi:hypothetical protein
MGGVVDGYPFAPARQLLDDAARLLLAVLSSCVVLLCSDRVPARQQ